MSNNTATNVLPFKLKTAPRKAYEFSRKLNPNEMRAVSTLVSYVAYLLEIKEAEIIEITQRVFGVCDLSYLPAKDLGTVIGFLVELSSSSKAKG